MLCLWALPAAASAQELFAPGDVSVEILDSAGGPETRAGAHPDRFLVGIKFSDDGGEAEKVKDLVIDLPEGLAGDLSAVRACPREAFAEIPYGVGGGFCDRAASTVGYLLEPAQSSWGILNLEPGPNEAGAFGQGIDFPLKFSLTPQVDGRLEMRLNNLPELSNTGEASHEFRFELWGVPADHGVEGPRRPLLTNPTRCDGAPTVLVSAHTWQHPERWFSGSGDSGHPQIGCAALPFAPTTDLSLGATTADTPTGADIEVAVPQDEDPDGQAASQVKAVRVALPEGMTISPGGAGGLATCSDAQLDLHSATDAACPPASRVGSVGIDASALGGDPLEGRIYLGQELPGARFRLFVVIQGRGFQLKFVGRMETDPRTGRLTADLSDLPQLPFDSMTLHFDGGPGALLATPLACGPARATATFTPYSATAPVQSGATVTIAGAGAGGACAPPPFAPSFTGGSTGTAAGRPTSFRTLLTRRDGEALPARMEIAFPPGLSAAVGSVGRCAGPAADTGTCPASSRVGGALAELGPGPDPAQVRGQIYLTGPYRGEPFGLALAFRAKVGPLDLGTMVVRGSLQVDARSGELTARIDPLPQVFEGIAVRFQTIAMDIDRPGFLGNPTSCVPSRLAATLGSGAGQVFHTATPFRVSGCLGLPFRPDFALALGGASQLRRGGRPAVRVSLGVPSRGAAMRSADISLPGPLRLDSSAPAEICARREAMDGDCSKRARVGSATARTPLLEEPLKGSVYIAQPRGGGDPDLWTHLEGGGLSLDVRSAAVRRDGQLHTRLTDLPDIPVSRLTIAFDGGRHGLFRLDSGLCRHGRARALRGRVLSEAHNGVRVRASVPVQARAKC